MSMDFGYSIEAEQLRAQMRAALAAEWPAGRYGYRAPDAALDYERHKEFRRQIGRHGWFGLGIPAQFGGSGGTTEQRFVVAEELAYHGVVYPKVAVNMVGPILVAHGSDDLKARFLPEIARGELEFAQAYSESEAGSDLASLRTTAVPDGDDLVIQGTKLYTSFIHRCEYCVVAVRTESTPRPHDGISLVIVPADAAGLSYSPLWGMGDLRTNVVVLDGVRVPRTNVIGGMGEGWRYLRTVLAFERLVSFGIGNLRPIVEDLLEWLAGEPDAEFFRDGAQQAELVAIEVGMRAMDALSRRTLWLIDQGADVGVESAQVKIFGTELRQRLTALAVDVLGPAGQLTPLDGDAPADGAIQRADEGAVMPTFGGGGNEILRDLIAKRTFARSGYRPARDF
jgi:3-oxocholest-4-en-26-oyl-CoA dehydrogenase alpha subunit